MKKLNRPFIADLKADVANTRQHHADHLLAVAGVLDDGNTEDGKTQMDFIDEAMRFSPKEFEIVLRMRMYRDRAPLADRVDAAALYLRGAEKKLWAPPKNSLRFARRLVGNFMMEDDMQKIEPTLAAKAAASALLAIRDAGLELAKVAANPAALKNERLVAVEKWISATRISPLRSTIRTVMARHSEFMAAGDELARRTVKEISE